jgi:hypothetical protein
VHPGESAHGVAERLVVVRSGMGDALEREPVEQRDQVACDLLGLGRPERGEHRRRRVLVALDDPAYRVDQVGPAGGAQVGLELYDDLARPGGDDDVEEPDASETSESTASSTSSAMTVTAAPMRSSSDAKK